MLQKSGNKFGPIFMGIVIVGALIWHYIDGIIFYGGIASFVGLYVYRVIKMQASLEEIRHGKVARAICGLLGVLAVIGILFYFSSLADSGAVVTNSIEKNKEKTFDMAMTLYLCSFGFFMGTILVMTKIRRKNSYNPSFGLRYLLAGTIALSASCFTVATFFHVGAVEIPVSRLTSCYFDLAKAGIPVFCILLFLHLFMSRMNLTSGEVARVHFFGSLLYEADEHGEIIAPPLFMTLQLFCDLLGQMPIGFSVDYRTMREPIVVKRRYELSQVESGELLPTKLSGTDNKNGGDSKASNVTQLFGGRKGK